MKPEVKTEFWLTLLVWAVVVIGIFKGQINVVEALPYLTGSTAAYAVSRGLKKRGEGV